MTRIRKRFGTSLDPELIKTLDNLSEKTRITKSKLIDEALEDLFKKYNDILGV
jgi:metal-responsive CopG/Arc/MetJ family transcriptional regulator